MSEEQPDLSLGVLLGESIDKALEFKQKGEEGVIGFNVSGHGFLDMEGFAKPLGLEW